MSTQKQYIVFRNKKNSFIYIDQNNFLLKYTKQKQILLLLVLTPNKFEDLCLQQKYFLRQTMEVENDLTTTYVVINFLSLFIINTE